MKIKILGKNGNKEVTLDNQPVILQMIGSKTISYHINRNGSLSRVYSKKKKELIDILINKG